MNGIFNSLEQPQPDDHGFEYWFSTQNNANVETLYVTSLPPRLNRGGNFVRNGTPVGRIEGYSSEIIVDEAIAWLATHPLRQAHSATSRDTTKPFWLRRKILRLYSSGFIRHMNPIPHVKLGDTADEFMKPYEGSRCAS